VTGPNEFDEFRRHQEREERLRQILVTFRRKIDVCGIVVDSAAQGKTRRGDRRGDKLDDVVTA
jgi:hypothetical protein